MELLHCRAQHKVSYFGLCTSSLLAHVCEVIFLWSVEQCFVSSPYWEVQLMLDSWWRGRDDRSGQGNTPNGAMMNVELFGARCPVRRAGRWLKAHAALRIGTAASVGTFASWISCRIAMPKKLKNAIVTGHSERFAEQNSMVAFLLEALASCFRRSLHFTKRRGKNESDSR